LANANDYNKTGAAAVDVAITLAYGIIFCPSVSITLTNNMLFALFYFAFYQCEVFILMSEYQKRFT
jgi:hypothetical protein